MFLFFSLLGQANASAFLRKDVSAMVADTHLYLLEELEGTLGEAHRQATERRMVRLEDALRPTVAALPKNPDGKLGHMAVRYVLHRLFVEKHGWYVRGLAPQGDSWNSSSPIAMLQDKAPQAIFENHLGNHTFGLHEVAVLAATLENLVHEEMIERLNSAFKLHDYAMANLTEDRMEEVIDTYMIHYVIGDFASERSPKEIRKDVVEMYPKWHETAKFIREVRREVLDRADANPNMLSFNDTMEVLGEIGERYGRWQDLECRELKHDLIKLENQGTGRVLLKDFYGAAAGGAWQFSESVQYLRQIGALDESDPARLKVIIANYINAPSNCVASSNFYSVCCIDECEALIGQLERTIAAPQATPERVAEVISALPSPTVEAPRELPASLRGHLDEIARHHGNGLIPLHGRLLAQVMHHAFPRECNFPHVTGTTRLQTLEEWIGENGHESATATREEMMQHIENAIPHKEEESLPWVEEEELFCVHPPVLGTSAKGSLWWKACHGIAFVAILMFASIMLFQTFASAGKSLNTNPNKFYV
jgi:hypothetical protein